MANQVETAKEIEMLKNLRSPHIIEYVDNFTDLFKTFIITELCDVITKYFILFF